MAKKEIDYSNGNYIYKMYLIKNIKTNEVYSQILGWVELKDETYGHAFEQEEAEELAQKFAKEGIETKVIKYSSLVRSSNLATYAAVIVIIAVVLFLIMNYI